MDDLEPPSASDCPFEEGTALHRDWCRRQHNDFLFADVTVGIQWPANPTSVLLLQEYTGLPWVVGGLITHLIIG